MISCKWCDITDGQNQVLKLRLAVEDRLIGFYRLDTGEKLLILDELLAAHQQEAKARQQAEERTVALEAELARHRERFGDLPQD